MRKALSLLVAACVISAGALFTSVRADTGAATTRPAATQASAPACCGDECQKMGTCCTTDGKGKITCPMGGSCCINAGNKDENKPANKNK